MISNELRKLSERVKREIKKRKFLLRHGKHLKNTNLEGFCPNNDWTLTTIYLRNGYKFMITEEELYFLPTGLYEEIIHLRLCVEAWEEENKDTIEFDPYYDIA